MLVASPYYLERIIVRRVTIANNQTRPINRDYHFSIYLAYIVEEIDPLQVVSAHEGGIIESWAKPRLLVERPSA